MDTPRWRRSPAQSPEDGKCVAQRLKRVLRLGVVLALVGAGCGSGGRLGAKALLQQSKSLQSEAAEGALLAQDAASGKTTAIYTREHASALYRAASQIDASLKSAHSADLRRLGSASEDEQRVLTRELQAAVQASQKIGEGLM
jgi:hypothetical protein